MAIDAVVKQTVDLAVQQAVDQLQLALAVVARVAKQHYVAMIQRGLQQYVRHRGDEGIADIGHNQPIGFGAARRQRARHAVGAIAGQTDGVEDALARAFRHRTRAVINDVADHRNRCASQFCDVAARHFA